MADEKNEQLDIDHLNKIMFSNIIKEVFHNHQVLVSSIRNLPITDELKTNIIYSIGCGYLWAKDAIEALHFNQTNSQEKQAELVPESLNGIEPIPHVE